MQSRFHIRTLAVVAALCLNAGQPLAVAGPSGLAAPGIAPPPPGNPAASGQFGNATLAQCAPGFIKTSEHKGPAGHVDKFVCTTPVIKCPKNPNYSQSAAEGKVDTSSMGQYLEQGVLTLRYSCTYSTPQG